MTSVPSTPPPRLGRCGGRTPKQGGKGPESKAGSGEAVGAQPEHREERVATSFKQGVHPLWFTEIL